MWENTYYPENLRDAKLFLESENLAALNTNPGLAGAYGVMAAIDKETKELGLDEQQREAVLSKARHNLAEQIKGGTYPDVKIREEIEIKREQSDERSIGR